MFYVDFKYWFVLFQKPDTSYLSWEFYYVAFQFDRETLHIRYYCIWLFQMTTTVLVTGASGLLGRQIMHVFEKDSSLKTIGLAFSRAQGNLHKVDLTNFEDLTKTFEKFSVNILGLVFYTIYAEF